jgi:ADP-heptose:LPS heptosyltransferase
MKKALLINLSGIGDIVSSLVVANPLASEYEITYLIPKVFIGMLADSNFKESHEVDATEYDLLIDLTTNKESRKIVQQSNATNKIGRCKNVMQKFRFRKIYSKMLPKFTKPIHIVKDYYPINNYLNLNVSAEIFLNQATAKNVTNVVSIHVGADKVIRRIPEILIVKAIEFLQSKNLQVRMIGIEQDVIDSILDKTKNVIYEKGNLSDVRQWLKDSLLTIASDSGLFHLSTALNTPSIGMYGPNTSARAGSLNNKVEFLELDYNCRPCNQNIECPFSNKCMNDITWKMLETSILKLI